MIIDSQTEVPEVKVCTAALRLMFQILNWDFHNTVGAKASINFYFVGVKDHGDSTKRSEYNLVQVNKFLLLLIIVVIIDFLTLGKLNFHVTK